MPNLRGHSVTPTGITVTGSDGRTARLTNAEIVADYATRTGSRAARRSATGTWSRQQIAAAVGAETAPESLTDLDFDELTGQVTALGFRTT